MGTCVTFVVWMCGCDYAIICILGKRKYSVGVLINMGLQCSAWDIRTHTHTFGAVFVDLSFLIHPTLFCGSTPLLCSSTPPFFAVAPGILIALLFYRCLHFF